MDGQYGEMKLIVKIYSMTEKPTANWRVECNVECPECDEYIDLLEMDDYFEILPSVCEKCEDVEVYCTECGHEFKVDIEY